MPRAENDNIKLPPIASVEMSEDDDEDVIESQPELPPETEVAAITLENSEPISNDKQLNKKKKKLKTRSSGIIVYFFSILFSQLYKCIRNSGITKALTSYDKTAETFRRSFLYNTVFSNKMLNRVNKFKVGFRRLATDAHIPKLFERFSSSLLLIRCRIYGLILLLFGITSFTAHYAFSVILNLSVFSDTSARISSVCVCAVALLFVFSNDTLESSIKESSLLGAFVYDLMGIKRRSSDSNDIIELSSGGACILGVLLGLLTAIFPANKILLTVLSVIYAIIVIRSPESGIISIILFAPFAPLNILGTATVLLIASYMYKVLCGKRTLKLEFPDLIVGLFALTVMLAENVSFGGKGTPVSSILFISVYFIVVSILRSEIWFNRAIRSVTLGVSVISAGAVILYFLGEFAVTGIFASFSASAYRGITSHILLYTLFIVIANFLKEKNKNTRFGLLIVITCATAYLCLTLSPYALIAAITALSVFALLCNIKMIFPILGIAIIRVLMAVFGIGGFIFNSISTEKSSLIGSNIMIRLLSQFGFTGIGASDKADSIIGASVSLGNQTAALAENSLILRLALELGYIGVILFVLTFFFILQGSLSHGRSCPDKFDRYRLLTYAGMCGLLSAFICGIWENIWLEPRMALIYWLIAGITVSCIRCSTARLKGNDQEMFFINSER